MPKIDDEPRDDMMFFPFFNGCSMFFLQKKTLGRSLRRHRYMLMYIREDTRAAAGLDLQSPFKDI